MVHGTLLAQESHARVEAVFANAESARAVAARLSQVFDLDPARICQLSPEQSVLITQRNKFDHPVSGRALQRRQLKFTFIAFALLMVGMLALHLLNEYADLSRGQVTLGLAVLIAVSAILTVHGLLSWRHTRVRARSHPREDGKVLLQIDVHDVSEQYQISQALHEMGVDARTSAIAGDA